MRWDNASLSELAIWSAQSHKDRNRFGALFEGYGVRRHEHAAKMALLFACARVHSSITLDDWNSAIELLDATEKLLPEVLSLVGANPQRPREDQILDWVRQHGTVRETNLRAYIRNFVNTRDIGMTLEELMKAGMLTCTTPDQVSPHRKFKA